MLPLQFIDRVKFFLERQFVKGALFQLLIVAAIIGLISLVGGLLVMPINEASTTMGEAVWWAFLRLTDPGYLGDDDGTWRRIISTILTVSGYVVFLGALVAIMTQWLMSRMRQLEQGLTPVALKHHVVILGWTNRTLLLIRELVDSDERMRRFLQRHDTSHLRLVVLAEQVSALHARQLREEPGIGKRARRVIFRSGTPLQAEALQRAACLSAAVIIVPSGSHGPNSLVTSDVETIKALLSIDSQARTQGLAPPYVVAEIQDVRKLPVVKRAYAGPLEVVAGDATISRLMAQNILHPGLSQIYRELLTSHDGNEFYVRGTERCQGETLAGVAARCPRAILCGVLRRQGGQWQPLLNPSSDLMIEADDRLVMMAASFEDTDPTPTTTRRLEMVKRRKTPTLRPQLNSRHHSLLILGWNHKVPALIHELGSYSNEQFEVDNVSVVATEERARDIGRYSEQGARVKCHYIEADYMLEGELSEINPAAYDTIILLSSDRLVSGEEADARAIVGYMILDEMLQTADRYPQILVELSDPDNEPLVSRNQSETIISPLILSHMLSQVALRPEVRLVFDELFTVGGAEILFRDPADYQLKEPLAFWKLEAIAAGYGETALGVYRAQADTSGKRLLLNPPRDTAIGLAKGDLLVVLTLT